MGEKRDLVLGAVRGYSFEQLRPFVVSLNQVKRDTDVVLLWNGLRSTTLAALTDHDVLLEPFIYRGSGAGNSWRRFWPIVAPLVRRLNGRGFARTILRFVLPLQTARFLAYRDFLLAHQDEYRHVLITDVRDVVFQDDPFRGFNGEFMVFEEDANIRLADDTACNAAWVEDLFGREMLAAIGQFPILCSGTIMGSARRMIEYLAEFEKLLLRAKSVRLVGSDQGVHNVLCRTVLEPPPHVSRNVGGAVLTMGPGIAEGNGFTVSSGGVVLDPAGSPIPILHQYDRHPEIAARLVHRLCRENAAA